MPNCRRVAESLANAFFLCEEIKTTSHHPNITSRIKAQIEDLDEYLKETFSELNRHPFEGYDHDVSQLRMQTEGEHLQPYFVNLYIEDIQKQILNQGWLDLIDCQCKR